MKKRNLFAEIAEGFDALANERAGKQPAFMPLPLVGMVAGVGFEPAPYCDTRDPLLPKQMLAENG